MQEFFVTFEKELYVFLLSLIPVVELRGAIPVGIGMGLDVMTTFIVAVIGNIIPVPFILLLTRPFMSLIKKTKALKPFAEWIEGKIEKNREKIMRYSAFGLFLFVAIPIPGTGAWSGAIAASALDMRMKYALPSIVAGVVTAGVIMCFGTSLVKWVINIF